MIIYIYPKCSTCKKAVKYLEDNGVKFEVRDIILETPKDYEMLEYIKLSGRDVRSFFNSSGIKYRELGVKDKLDEMSEKEKIDLLVSDGMLIKRPLLIGKDFVLSGFRENAWSKVIKN